MNVASLLVPARLLELRRFLRRRLPADLVEDVAQSAACEAWAARDQARGEGFLFGVARHEAYDALRARSPLADPESAAASDEHESARIAPSSVAHAELAEVLEYVEARPHLHAPMKWLVREHEGDSFEEIATTAGLSAAAVRQRVSRLRRELRAVFAIATVALLILGVLGAHRYLGPHAVAIAPSEVPPDRVAPALEEVGEGDPARIAMLSDEWLSGTWKVESTNDLRLLPFVGARVDLTADGATISTPMFKKSTIFTRDGAHADIAVSGHSESVTLHPLSSPDHAAGKQRLRIDGAFGSATLVRTR